MENVPRNPWKAIQWGETIGIRQEGRDTHVALINPWGNFSSGIPSREDAANARLIAAAPELLEALKFCLSVIEDQGVFDASEKMAVTKALAAIAKATGQTPETAK